MAKKKEIEIKNFYGRKISVKNDKNSKIGRINWYLLEGFVFAFIFSLIDVVAYYVSDNVISIFEFTSNKELNMYIYVLIEFVILYTISFIIDYMYYELRIRKINKN